MAEKIIDIVLSIKWYIVAFIAGAIFAGCVVFWLANSGSDQVLAGMRTQIERLNGDITELTESNGKLRDTEKQLRYTSNQLTEELGRRQKAISQLEVTNSNLVKSSNDLRNTNRELERTNRDLERTNNDLRKTNSDLERTNTELERTSRERQAFIDDLAKSTGELGTRIREAKDDIGRLKEYIQFVADTVSKVRNIIQNSAGRK